MRWMRCATLILCGVTLAAPRVQAQGPAGAITGTVTDESGATLPGVTVSVSGDRLIGGVHSEVTSPAGIFRFDRLPPGLYDVRAELVGFRTFERLQVRVDANFTATVNVRLSVGAVAETITVVADSPTVDTTSNLQQTIMAQELLENVPTGKDPWSIAKLVPGVQVAKFDVGGTQSIQQSSMSVHGSQPGDVVYAIDGLNTNWPGGSGGATSSYYDQGMFEQINFATSAHTAEQATGGIVINMVSKEGGNAIRGHVNAFFSNDDLQASNHQTPELERFGFQGGNPVTRLNDVNFSAGGPLVRNRLWWFVAYRRFALDRLTLGALNPDGSAATDDNLQSTYSGKLASQISNTQKLTFLYSINYNNRLHRRDPPPAFIPDEATVRATARHVTMGPRYTIALGRSLALESAVTQRDGLGSFGYQPGLAQDALRSEDSLLNTASGAAPGHQIRPNGRIQFNNTATFDAPRLAGAHTFKTGVQWARQSFETRDFVHGDLHLIFRDGVPNSVRVYNTPTEARSFTHQLGIFLQDSWRLGSRLTLNAGGRFDVVKGWAGDVSVPAGRFVGARTFPRRNVLDQSRGVWRTGLVYDPFGDGRTAVKVSASRYAAQVGIDRVSSVNPGVNSSGTRLWNDLNGDRLAQDNELGPFSGFAGGVNQRYANADGPDWPYSDEVTAGVEHQLMQDVRVSAMYYHRTGRDIVGRRNIAVPTTAYTEHTIQVPGSPTGPGGTATLFNLAPAFFGLQDIVLDNDPRLDTDYDGVEFTASKRFTGRWQLMGGMTFGRNRGGTDTGELNDPNNLNNQQGVVGLDSQYSFKVSGSYLIPGDLMVSASVLRSDGFPYQSTYSVARSVFPALTRASQNVRLSANGDERLADVTLIDLRISRPFRLSETLKIEPLLEMFNLANASTVVTLTPTVGTRYLAPTEILGPRLFRIGFRVEF